VATILAPAGANVWGVAVDPQANRLYATDIASPRVLVYDGATNALAAEIAIDAPARFGIAE
jgi:DNA-binding beta-propeller fold protein YncE